jgi:hypothetical protein
MIIFFHENVTLGRKKTLGGRHDMAKANQDFFILDRADWSAPTYLQVPELQVFFNEFG